MPLLVLSLLSTRNCLYLTREQACPHFLTQYDHTHMRCAEQSDSEAEGEWEGGGEKLVSDRTVLVWGDEMLGANGRLKVGTYLMLLNHTPYRS